MSESVRARCGKCGGKASAAILHLDRIEVLCDECNRREPVPHDPAVKKTSNYRIDGHVPRGAPDGSRHELPQRLPFFRALHDADIGWTTVEDFSYVCNRVTPTLSVDIAANIKGELMRSFDARLIELESRYRAKVVQSRNHESYFSKSIHHRGELDHMYGSDSDGYFNVDDDELRLRGRMVDNYHVRGSYFFPSPALYEAVDWMERDDEGQYPPSGANAAVYARWEPIGVYQIETLPVNDVTFNHALLRRIDDSFRDFNSSARPYADSIMAGAFHTITHGPKVRTYVAYDTRGKLRHDIPPARLTDDWDGTKDPKFSRWIVAFLTVHEEHGTGKIYGGGPLDWSGFVAFKEMLEIWLERVRRRIHDAGGPPNFEPLVPQLSGAPPCPIRLTVPYALVHFLVGKRTLTDISFGGKTYPRLAAKIDLESAFSGGRYPRKVMPSLWGDSNRQQSASEDRFYTSLIYAPDDPNKADAYIASNKLAFNGNGFEERALLGMYGVNKVGANRYSVTSMIRHALLVRSRELLFAAADVALRSLPEGSDKNIGDYVVDVLSDLWLNRRTVHGTRPCGDAEFLLSETASSELGRQMWFRTRSGPSRKFGTDSLIRLTRAFVSVLDEVPGGLPLKMFLIDEAGELSIAVAGELCACTNFAWGYFRGRWSKQMEEYWGMFASVKRWSENVRLRIVNADREKNMERNLLWIRAVLKRQGAPDGVPWPCRAERTDLSPVAAREVALLLQNPDVSDQELAEVIRDAWCTQFGAFKEEWDHDDRITTERIKIVTDRFKTFDDPPKDVILCDKAVKVAMQTHDLATVLVRCYAVSRHKKMDMRRIVWLYTKFSTTPARYDVPEDVAEQKYRKFLTDEEWRAVSVEWGGTKYNKLYDEDLLEFALRASKARKAATPSTA